MFSFQLKQLAAQFVGRPRWCKRRGPEPPRVGLRGSSGVGRGSPRAVDPDPPMPSARDLRDAVLHCSHDLVIDGHVWRWRRRVRRLFGKRFTKGCRLVQSGAAGQPLHDLAPLAPIGNEDIRHGLPKGLKHTCATEWGKRRLARPRRGADGQADARQRHAERRADVARAHLARIHAAPRVGGGRRRRCLGGATVRAILGVGAQWWDGTRHVAVDGRSANGPSTEHPAWDQKRKAENAEVSGSARSEETAQVSGMHHPTSA